ncbi:snare-like protein [Cystobasidium minutum MCA 4210]|uniref:snare-like protein n=1 Tax=Cystobasidium minutum MCA 4210 TaxID=1397322 RepID=UPI0034CD4192|eukprot:jgi/Rhomi1/42406/CE42405_4610
MTIYSLYIFDRHCECIYYQGWHRTTPTRPGKDVLPNVAPDTRIPSKAEQEAAEAAATSQAAASPKPNNALDYASVPRAPGSAVLPSTRSQSQAQQQQQQLGLRGVPVLVSAEQQQQAATQPQKRGLPFDEECKLVYGVIFSLRSMMKKLSSKEDEAFISFRTSTYKLHLFETLSGFKFVLFSDANVDSLRFVLRQIYQGAFVEFVLRNPMIEVDSRVSGEGIDSQAFRMSVHKFISELSVFR